jgi:hypothetical protein
MLTGKLNALGTISAANRVLNRDGNLIILDSSVFLSQLFGKNGYFIDF